MTLCSSELLTIHIWSLEPKSNVTLLISVVFSALLWSIFLNLLYERVFFLLFVAKLQKGVASPLRAADENRFTSLAETGD